MKKTSKALLLSLCAVVLVTASVLGTMAYLTDNDQVVNTFTVGNVAIDLDEADVKLDGTYEVDHDTRVKANDYKLLPGHTYIKDPTVTVKANSEAAYVRMLVTFSNASALKEVFGPNFLPENFVDGWDSQTWISTQEVAEDTVDDTVTYEFRYKEIVPAASTDTVLDDLFESFTIPGTLTNEQLAKLDDMDITVVAHAIQADGFDSAKEAWTAFDGE